MKLSEYLNRNNLSLGQLAKRCGTSASTILRIKDGDVAPSKRVARALWNATNGQVTPNDLYGLHYAGSKDADGAGPNADEKQQEGSHIACQHERADP